MSGMGRGGRGIGLLQALEAKKKKEEEEKEASQSRGREALLEIQEKEQKQKELEKQEEEKRLLEEKRLKSEELAKETTQKPMGRGLGRGGMLSSLIKKTAVTSADIKSTEVKEPVSSETPPIISKVEDTETKPSALKIPSKLLAMGRGTRLSTKPVSDRISPTTETQPAPIKAEIVTPNTDRPLESEAKTSQSTTSGVVQPKEEKPKSGKSSLITGDKSSQGQTGSGQYMSTVSSIEKAVEELKIEHILRQSPVKKVGEAGTSTEFSTNYIKLKCNNQGVYQYVVQYDPPQDNVYFRQKLLYGCGEAIGSVKLFDGHTLFLPLLLKEKVTVIQVKPRDETKGPVTLKIQLTKILPPEQIPPVVFNIIFKSIMRVLRMSRIGQHYFSSKKQIDIPNHGLQIWPGYSTAVHEYEDGLYLVIDVTHKVLRSETCWNLMGNLHRNARGIESFRENVFNAIIGNVVLTRYNNKTYRIDDIMWDENPLSEFVYQTDKKISYYQYYKEHYNIEIKDLKQPLLLHRAKKSKQAQEETGEKKATEMICLIPELCFMTGMSEDIKNDIRIKKDLAAHTRLTPKQRCEQLMELIQTIRETPEASKYITNWGLELDDNLTRTVGRVLPREKIIFAKKEVETDGKCDWTRPAGNEQVVKGVDIKNWLIVYPQQKEAVVEHFCTMAMDCSRRTGIKLSMPNTVALKDDRPDTYYNEIKNNLNEHIQMVVVIFNMISDSRYARVKKLCCIECPVPSQVIVLRTINKPDNVLKTIAQKIILQMNVKLGGELWRLSIPIKKCMIVGIDVYHKTERKYQSIAGFVSSLNHDQTRWYSKVCFQMVGQELTDTLKIAFMSSLKKYQEVNGFLPEKIFIYRDGVSEGQLSVVSEHEVKQLRSCFANDYCPQIVVIVVQKRISTRIFSTQNRDFVNPAPGAIIDHTVTSKDNFDFFIVSQHVGQGTVTPTHYIVAYDDTQMKPDHIQRLSYKMTHLYYNWSGTIRVPAPCQYAHKIAFLTGQYLMEEPSEALCDRLFYL